MKAGKILLGVITGVAAGAAAGLLFAPKKGADTRRRISETSDNYLQNAKSRLNEFGDSLNHKVEALKSRSKATLSKSKSEEKINKAKADLHDMSAS